MIELITSVAGLIHEVRDILVGHLSLMQASLGTHVKPACVITWGEARAYLDSGLSYNSGDVRDKA